MDPELPTRPQALDAVSTVIQNLLTSKGQTEAKRVCFNICSDDLDYAQETAVGGNQLWLVIFPTNMIADLITRMSTGTLDSPTKLAVANLWRKTLMNIITILAKATKAM